MAKRKFPVAPVAIAVLSGLLTACGGGSSSSDTPNTAPTFDATSLSVTLAEDTSFDGNLTATDADGDQISFSVTQSPENGTLTLAADGSYSYMPKADFFGSDTAKVQASDGSASTSGDLVFTVTGVNDAPVISGSSLAVDASGDIIGQVNAIDVDGDTLTYSVEVAPESGTLVLDPVTGKFTYKPELTSFANEFTVGVTDGIADKVVKVIQLKPEYGTNQQKQDFYYTSELSHLKQAEVLIETIAGDSAADPAYYALAQGYAAAGFTDKTDQIIDQDIIFESNQAEAYKDIGAEYNAKGLYADGDAARDKGLGIYNRYIADKGFASFSNTDGTFYQTLLNGYIDSGSETGADNVIGILALVKEALKSDEVSTAYKRLVTSFDNYADSLLTIYLNDRTEENRLKLVAAIDRLVAVADDTGYQELTSSYSNAGKPHYYQRGTYYAFALTLYNRAEEVDKAKELIARIIALYTDVTHDEAYNRSAHESAVYTLEYKNRYPLQVAAGAAELYYSELSTNPVLAFINLDNTRESYVEDIQEEIDAQHGLSIVLNGGTVKQATEHLIALEDGNTLNQFRAVAEQTITLPGLASHLIAKGENDAAKEAIETAKGILISSEHIEARVSSPSYVIGSYGCGKLMDMQLRMGATEDAQSMLTTCQALVADHYPTTSEDVLTADLIEARQDLAANAAKVGNTQVAIPAIIEALGLIDLVSDFEDRIEWRYEFAQSAALNGLLEEATTQTQVLVDDFFDNYDQYVADNGDDQEAGLELAIEILEQLVDTSLENSASESYAVIKQTRFFAAENNYAEQLVALKAQVKRLNDFIDTKLQAQSATVQANINEDWIPLLGSAREFELGNQVIAREANAEANKLELTATLSQFIAQQDDFPSTVAANVDTDQDGKPNFFITTATEEQVIASGLTADDDADGDGIVDENDINPLVPDVAQ
ncbi:hypothetical protein EXU30_08650 [Shewanella maritima]|uniref:Cadherin domain-containing protein n=1 Tax=Shewanella maritima TaxID=2520507 RepID=A0A411PHB3_9GAMM|nr:cadherin-like domain-containing protein [Shewanella maritima]QBF82750.1 hypothetical protein EXU30_08650 [Shewanella maritima]